MKVPCLLEQESSGDWLAWSPKLPECNSQAVTQPKARQRFKIAALRHLADQLEAGELEAENVFEFIWIVEG